MTSKRLFSGIQPSGELHLGNYLGAIKNWIHLQNNHDAFFCVVDLHAITVPQDPMQLRLRTLDIAKTYIACGIDPEQSTLFVQSQVSAHSELMWILNTITRMGDLDKMTQFKDKTGMIEKRERSGVGLYDYPVLMAADILLYDTEMVPVGEDQVQHLELARTLARRFNKRFGETFRVPDAYVMAEGARIMGLDDPGKKMSKSAPSENNYIALLDDPERAKKKIMKAVTDSGTTITYSKDRPALKNLINIFALLSDVSPQAVVSRFEGKGYADFKRELAEVVIGFLTEFQKQYRSLSDEDVLVHLERGAMDANKIALSKIQDVRQKVGFLH